MKCNVFYFEIHFYHSFTAILSPDESGFNVAYFLIIDIVVMVTLTAGESVVLLLLSSRINVTPKNLLSAPKLQIQNVSHFLSYTMSITSVNVVLRMCLS